jgi:hypothetical protein
MNPQNRVASVVQLRNDCCGINAAHPQIDYLLVFPGDPKAVHSYVVNGQLLVTFRITQQGPESE